MSDYQLKFTTDYIDACINKYEPISFEYRGWTVCDHYEHNEKNTRWSRYNIILLSNKFSEEDALNNYRIEGESIVNLLTLLIPVSGLPSLHYSKYNDFLHDSTVFDYKSNPQGWNTNYNELLKQIKKDKNEEMHVHYTFMGLSRYSTLEESPLKDIQLMLNRYEDINEEVKFLLFLLFSILKSEDINLFMLIGKALEIINAMYPYNSNHSKPDKRIEKFFPELKDVFKETTIKDLITLSNYRKETRHYIKDKNNLVAHDSLSSEERKKLYTCSTYLILVVLRAKFGLDT